MMRRARCACQALALVGLLSPGSCAPTTHGLDGSAQDLVVPTDLAGDADTACQGPAANLLIDPGFETAASGDLVANNAGGAAGVLEPWRGCCGTSQTSTWTVSTTTPHCGRQSIMLQGTAATTNVLLQNLTIAGGSPSEPFIVTAWVKITSASPGAALLIDVQNTAVSPSVTLAESSPALSQITPGWVQITASGMLPSAAGTPAVQFRFNDSGTMTAFLDDAAMVLQ